MSINQYTVRHYLFSLAEPCSSWRDFPRMEDLMLHCSRANVQLQNDAALRNKIPSDLLETICHSNGSQYLDALATAALLSGCTDGLFILYRPLIAEITARWIDSTRHKSRDVAHKVTVLSCLARIFPFARYLRPCVISLFQDGFLDQTVWRAEVSSSDREGAADVQVLLLALFRLLSTEPATFRDLVKPTFLSSFLRHKVAAVRYLAVQCFCIVMRLADALEESLIKQYVADDYIGGSWEGAEIDYRLLKLFEEQRWEKMQRELIVVDGEALNGSHDTAVQIPESDLSTFTAVIGGTLLPRMSRPEATRSRFVKVPNAVRNINKIGQALQCEKPIVVLGSAGSGKTELITEAARLMSKHTNMVTLHLNEQTDAKSLLGVYTSSDTGGGFVWQPGVLSQAIQQGRWVLIEDIDRAPAEVLGILRPIIETGELYLPSRKERLRPANGFQLFATIRTSFQADNVHRNRHAWLSNNRLWTVIQTSDYKREEIQDLISSRYQLPTAFSTEIMQTHERVCEAYRDDDILRTVQSRLPSMRDLLKWCTRLSARLGVYKDQPSPASYPEALKFDIFKDAVDCYVALHSDDSIRQHICQVLAQSMNLSPQQGAHLTQGDSFTIEDTKTQVSVGRSTLPKIMGSRTLGPKKAKFATTASTKMTLEAIAAGVSFAEPLLLVGETGVGKTTVVQHVANLVGQTLTVVNLSQQSEATDLLGGLKPITVKSLIVPMMDRFSQLFDDTFSNKRNEKFQIAISKAVAKQNWSRVVFLWQEAVQMADNVLKKPGDSTSVNDENKASKRRKISSKHAALRDRWTDFSSGLVQIRTQIARGDKNQTFAFVEGRLVQAVRNGEWLLLDEINLASADTLDHVVGLLQTDGEGKRSLLLAEAGGIEQIPAHANFRVFAAMNPATDTGKKDLAPGIRSRFTEVYVNAGDNDIQGLVKIIEAYIGHALSSDKRASFDLASAYLELKKLNDEHKLTDGAGDAPHFSIRSLVRCLLYVVQHHPSHGVRRSIYEGFAMSFFTVLSRASENIAIISVNKHLLSSIKNYRSFLSQHPRYPTGEDTHSAFGHHRVLKGGRAPDMQTHYIRTPSVERNLVNLARAASMRRFPILLQGPTSAGKTSMVEYLAKLSGNDFVRINNHEHTDLQEYLGSYGTRDDGKLEFREGVLVEALRKGHWIVLDELNLAPSDVLEALNRLLDDNRELLIPETQEIVRPHSNFMLFATQNPAGLYGGRKRLSRAFRNRFLELHFDDIPENELEVILSQRAQIPASFCAQIVQVYKKLGLQRQSSRLFEQQNSFATLRDLFRWASRPVDDRQQLAQHGFMLLGERVRDAAERKVVKTTIEETMNVKLDESTLYGLSTIPESISSSPGIVWTSAMRRLFVLVTAALKNNEPVLLVGATGCGKTQICQTVAQALGRVLNIYNAHSNTETGDLIGSQRPIRQRSELAHAVVKNIASLEVPEFSAQQIEDRSVDRLIEQFNRMDTSSFDPALTAKARQSIGAYQSLFAWHDGSLVRSMKAGEHFLLDEISLAEDSVLERLNSVLEPSRTILLAEKGTVDNNVVADAEFQFLATMNPGGDYGKRELSAALRNRLTEVWVPGLSQSDDILPILQGKLKAEDSRFANMMLEFATWFRDVVQNSTTADVSLRSLLTWAAFMERARILESSIAFIHGALMVFVDSLGANPAGLLASTGTNVDTTRRLCLDKLQSMVDVDVNAIYNQPLSLEIVDAQVQLGPFTLHRVDQSVFTPQLVFDAPTTLKNTLRIVRALQMNRPILLEGSPGVGKTAIVTALAETVGKPLTRINLSDQTDLMDLFGADAPLENEGLGKFAWRDGPLLRAMQSGGWVLLDEMNLASQSVLEGLNSCLDHRHEVYIAELDKSFICHPEFTLFAAQNPHQQGGGRKGLPASFVNRFTVVYTDPFEKEDLLQICRRTRPNVDLEQLNMILDTVTDLRALVSESSAFMSGGPWDFNLRDVNRWLDLCANNIALPPAHHFETIVSQRFRTVAAREQTLVLSQKYFSSARPSLFHNMSSRTFQLGTACLTRNDELRLTESNGFIPTSQLALFRSAIVALNYQWPLILCGPSGSGKTRMVHNLATISGAKLVEFSMNADVDTMDLIGGFEQYDLRRDVLAVQRDIASHIIKVVCGTLRTQNGLQSIQTHLKLLQVCSVQEIDLNILIGYVRQLVTRDAAFAKFIKRLEDLIAQREVTDARFVWNDGILIDALEEGSWLVLDNANLCNPSVLDRLNSLLETDGTLVVSEQHNSGQSERIIKPHPNFRIFLTMDPRHGELSRAMKNRSLELYLDTDIAMGDQIYYPVYATSASVSRLRRFVGAQSHDMTSATETALEPYIEGLSSNDLSVLATSNGVQADALAYHDQVKSQIALHQSCSIAFRGPVQDVSRTMMAQLDGDTGDEYLDDQPHFPTVNDALFNGRDSRHNIYELVIRPIQNRTADLARLQWLFIMQRKIAQQIDIHLAAAKTVGRDQMTILQRSSIGQGRDDYNVYAFMMALLKWSDSKIEALFNSELLQVILVFMRDFLELCSSRSLDHGVFQAFIQIAFDIIPGPSANPYSPPAELHHVLPLLDSKNSLRQGKSLQTMWSVWKPSVPLTLGQLQSQLSMEALLSKFDALSLALPQKRSALGLIRSRLIYNSATKASDSNAESELDILSRAINDLEFQAGKPRVQRGLFAGVFNQLLCRLVLQGEFGSESVKQMLALLAHNGSNDNLRPGEEAHIQSLRTFAFLDNSIDATDEADFLSNARFWDNAIHCTNLVQKQPLRALGYVEEEVEEFANMLSSYSVSIGRSALSQLRIMVQGLIKAVNSPFSDIDGTTTVKDHSRTHEMFLSVKSEHIDPAILIITEGSSPPFATTGLGLIHISLAALKLLVPEKVFDPAVYPTIVRKRHMARMEELQMKISSHQQFQQSFTGDSSSAMITLLQSDLLELGAAPEVPQIVRPPKSELHKIQEEYSNVIRGVIDSSQIAQLISSDQRKDISRRDDILACKGLLQTIPKLVKRLSCIHRAYDDMVQPVTWLLQCLSIGIRLLLQNFASNLGELKQSSSDEIGVPLIGGTPEQVLSLVHESNTAGLSGEEQVVQRLRMIELNLSLEGRREQATTPAISQALSLIDLFYTEWKNQLSKDQREAEAKSRYYAYRGEDETAQEDEDQEMATMFPTFDDDADAGDMNTRANNFDSRSRAILLADLHSQVVAGSEEPEKLSRYIRNVLEANNSSSGILLSNEPDSISMISAVLLQLEEAAQSLKGNNVSQSFNVYTDPDTNEVRKLLKIVENIVTRFEAISAQWPEHAVPIEVLAFSDEVLSFKLEEPIAKLLTKTEKLLDIVSQWQSVASREWTVSNLVDDLTNLIIHWRRLELSSWSRLLDQEQKSNDEDAKAWYFIAYEAVLVNSRLIVQQTINVTTYCRELASTVEEFLKLTSYGQFSSRLRLLDVYQSTLTIIAKEDERLLPIVLCLSSVLDHYRRYEADIKQYLATGRAELEKNIQEQIKLASWKDTSVTSLRESARRTHHKLFKIVRKYRKLLSQPLATFKAEILSHDAILNESNRMAEAAIDEKMLVRATQICTSRVQDWTSRPERLREPVGAAASMRRLYDQNRTSAAVSDLGSFQEDVVSTSKELRKLTPQTLTDDNKALVQHLRVRKRRLFADTMKSVMQMGIRRNLGTNELESQSSLAMVLSTSFDISASQNTSLERAANDAFHEILDAMPGVRGLAREHSDDLTDGEIMRGLGLLEGVLSVLGGQRMSISKMGQEIQQVTSILKISQALTESPHDQIIHKESNTTPKREWLIRTSHWIVEILSTACQVLEIQARHSDIQVNPLVSQFQESVVKLRTAIDTFDKLSILPIGLSSIPETNAIETCEAIQADLQSVIVEWQTREPRIQYLLDQISLWVRSQQYESTAVNGVVKCDVATIDDAVRQMQDRIFVAMQRLANVQAALPNDSEDPGWLIKTCKTFGDMHKSLHLGDIAKDVEHLLAQLHHLELADIAVASSILAIAAPVLEQYSLVAQDVYNRYLAVHRELCGMGVLLSKSFTALGKEGFCTPSEPSGADDKSGKLESGTGLGEGEGAEDISKDIGADEDLSELAQADGKDDKDDDSMDKSKDAVDMGADDLEGEMGSGDEQDSDDEDNDAQSGSEDENDMDEETGSVDELDPSAVDEKMWDDLRNEPDKEDNELKGDKQDGKKTDEQTAKEREKDKKEKDDEVDQSGEMDEEPEGEATDAEDEPEGQGRPEAENVDPHLQEEEALEIPDDIQFDGDDGKEEDISDDGMDEMSDIAEPDGAEPELKGDVSALDEVTQEDSAEAGEDDEAGIDDMDQEEGKAEDDEVIEDQSGEDEEKEKDFEGQEDDTQHDVNAEEGADTGLANQQTDDAAEDQRNDGQGQNDSEVAVDEQKTQSGQTSEQQQKGDASQGAVERGVGRENEQREQQDDALKKLAEVLEQFHQRREIFTASEDRPQAATDQDVDMADADFEHLNDDQDKDDAQALGAAAADQAQNLDASKAIEDNDANADQDLPMPDDNNMLPDEEQQESIAERFSRLQGQSREQGEQTTENLDRAAKRQQPQTRADMDLLDEDVEDHIETGAIETQRPATPSTSFSDAATIWASCSTRTHSLSLALTEQLRLILAPTTATKLRGDFRTGKRLNIKRIIPYIASGYKRDKIWMRRSVPSKRNYQIMIAVDDSKSMSESGADLLAFETLAMLSKSLSMLEVGELCIVSFGEEPHVRVAHPFGQPFTATESGPEVFRTFTFAQTGTNIRNLVRESISIFQDARLRSPSSNGGDLWQLQLILSDGHCSDHDSIRRLVRQAHANKIMIVFVVVDAGKYSIVNLPSASFRREDPLDEKSEMKLTLRPYLEDFPFQYYVVVRDVVDLPGVLARVLKGWFEGVVDV